MYALAAAAAILVLVLTPAFGCAAAASLLLRHPIPASLSGIAIGCWLVLARRTVLDRRARGPARSPVTPRERVRQ